MAAYWDQELAGLLPKTQSGERQWPLEQVFRTHLRRIQENGYVALLAFVNPSPENRSQLELLRRDLEDFAKRPAILSFGPRYLHSIGQLYKGGPDTGLFVIFAETDIRERKIPKRSFGFKGLLLAQSTGDFIALSESGRRVLKVDLGPAGENPLRAVRKALENLSHET
jgi:transaldolase/glucose-6-phosphate isomerase